MEARVVAAETADGERVLMKRYGGATAPLTASPLSGA